MGREYSIRDVFALLWPDFGELGRGELGGINAAVILLILAVTAVFGVFVWRERKAALTRIRGIHAVVDGVGQPQLAAKRLEMRRRSEELGPDVAHLWREFDETLVESADHTSLTNTLDAQSFFNSRTLAGELMHNRAIAVVPSILTAIGVLGTFIGLTTGLNGLNLRANDDVEQLKAGIDILISGAAVAFMTSVWGVFFSIITNLAEKFVERGVDARISSLQDTIDTLFKRHAPEQSLVRIMDTSYDTSVAMQELHEKIGSQLQTAVEGLSADMQAAFTRAIETAMAPSMSALVEQTSNQSSEVFEQLVEKFSASFTQIGTSQAERLDAASQGISQVLESMSGDMSSMLAEVKEQTDAQVKATALQSNAFRDRIEELVALSAKQQEVLEQSISRILTSLDSAAYRIGASTGSLDNAATHLADTASALSTASDQIGQRVAEAAGTLDEMQSKQEASLALWSTTNASLQQMLESVSAASRDLGAAAAKSTEGFTSLQNHQARFLADLKSRVEELNLSMSEWLEAYAEQTSQQVAGRMNEWNEHSREYAGLMLRTAQALSAAVDEMEVKVSAVDATARRV
jgi:predicted  nucleic acid-binding Zn-ribbon protein